MFLRVLLEINLIKPSMKYRFYLVVNVIKVYEENGLHVCKVAAELVKTVKNDLVLCKLIHILSVKELEMKAEIVNLHLHSMLNIAEIIKEKEVLEDPSCSGKEV